MLLVLKEGTPFPTSWMKTKLKAKLKRWLLHENTLPTLVPIFEIIKGTFKTHLQSGLCPDPNWGACNAVPDPLAKFFGRREMKKGLEEMQKEKEGKELMEERKGGKGRDEKGNRKEDWETANAALYIYELIQEGLAVASIARNDASHLPGMHRDHNAPACTATAGALWAASTMRGKLGSEFET